MKFDLSLYLVLDPEMCGGFDAALKLTQQVLDAGVTVLAAAGATVEKARLVALITTDLADEP